jgi:hypothetical protein
MWHREEKRLRSVLKGKKKEEADYNGDKEKQEREEDGTR